MKLHVSILVLVDVPLEYDFFIRSSVPQCTSVSILVLVDVPLELGDILGTTLPSSVTMLSIGNSSRTFQSLF